ncbi:FAD-binding oxidoreductase [Mycolicibacterium chubuense]|uniref:Putative FAD-linked oxidoreductase n=1 Tax=Mycolicibacterium chubuense TaxID=1800 RepID=A0A0J6YMT7_MYCCU|nr:FAD-linked oxidase C-terminal domain-containing protein [Mycolicibacterium chubuense]KMO74026.1 putative FAD-linked oxidoreductase [Mycolicibacterium chubuense]ORA47063.1 FAD-binding oxidoreductase [Mycolicibacterium chubuense]SPX97825.1 FAD/FMN-dependent dehydrogenase [Mycolicibacterium chubuense]
MGPTASHASATEAAIARFGAAAAAHGQVSTDESLLTERGRDFWGVGGVADLLVRPHGRDAIAPIMRLASEHGVAIVPRGGASNCSGGMMPTAGRVLLDLSGLDRILDIDRENRCVRVEPGVINSDLQEALAPYGLCFSPDPVSAHLASVAGNIIENAGGPHALKYGVTYNHVLSVDVVLPDGSAATFSADDQGPDLLGVLIGSEGTLGIITEATVALRPVADVTHSLMGAFATAREAADTIAAIIATGVVPAAVEWLDRAGIAGLQQFYDTGYPLDADSIVLIDVDGTAAEVAHDQAVVERVLRERATEVRIAEDEKDRDALWYGRLNAPNSVVQSGKGFFIGDVTVPRDRIPEMQEAIQATAARHRDGLLFIAVCGHAGDGDLHPTTFYDRDNPLAASALEAANNEIIEAAMELGGTITGEHGVGTEKIRFMTKRFSPLEIAAQRSIKEVFDPAGLLNPGVMLPDRSAGEPDTSGFGAAVRAALSGDLTVDPDAPLTIGGNTDISANLGNLSLTVGADATIESVNRYLDEHRVSCAAVPATGGQRTIGELVATATGSERDRIRHALLGADVTVIGGQTPARFGAETMKDVAGYDVKRLYISARGAFGALISLAFKISVKG